jgi:hypothetical protein
MMRSVSKRANFLTIRITYYTAVNNLGCVVCSEEVERCSKWSDNFTQQIDLAFNIFFMVYFFIRVSNMRIFFELFLISVYNHI